MWTAPLREPTQSKAELYATLEAQLQSLIADETDQIANLANCAALLFHSVPDVNWAGFYLLRDRELVLGPFQGLPACIRIPIGRGVCGSAAEQRKTFCVPNVDQFPGHIACDSASRSELVVPLLDDAGQLLGVLDLDSPLVARFDIEDQAGIERIAALLAKRIS